MTEAETQEGGPRMQSKKQEPHPEMWGMNLIFLTVVYVFIGSHIFLIGFLGRNCSPQNFQMLGWKCPS